MIDRLTVKNFKSIKEMDIDCKKINLFIGEPNTGKSNILEALGLLSFLGHFHKEKEESKLGDFIRYEELKDLFFEGFLDKKIEINVDKQDKLSIEMSFAADEFNIVGNNHIKKQNQDFHSDIQLNHAGEIIRKGSLVSVFDDFSFIKDYKFLEQRNFPAGFPSYLLPPNGSNLVTLIMSNKKIRELMAILVKDFNLNYMVKPSDKTIEIIKQSDDLIINYPYISTSDTLQRIIFFSVAMESNMDSTLIFEEPESFAFPYYTKYLGERIALDESNQYFISTHNPYLLLAILEKAPVNSVNLFISHLKDYQTRVKKLTGEEISALMDSEPFFNLNRFLEEE